MIALGMDILLWEERTCIYFHKTVGKKEKKFLVCGQFLRNQCSYVWMWYPKLNVLNLRWSWGVLFFTKGWLIMQELVSEVGVLDWRSKKGVAYWRLLPNFCYFSKNHNFWSIGRCTSGLLVIVDNTLHLNLHFSS